MRPFIGLLLGICLAATAAQASEKPRLTDGGDDVIHRGLVGAARAARDTTYLLGGPDRWDGKFETADGDSAWHGWVHDAQLDPPPEARWNVSDFNVPPGGGQYAMWCGTTYPNACGEGYGNNWNESLVFTYASRTRRNRRSWTSPA